MRSGTIKKRESIVPETIKKRLESYPGWSDLVRFRKKRAHYVDDKIVYTIFAFRYCLAATACGPCDVIIYF